MYSHVLAPHYLFFCYAPWCWQNSEQRKVSADTSTCTVWTVLVYRTVQLTIQHSKLPFYKWRGNGGVPDLLILIVFLSVFKKIVFLCLQVLIALILLSSWSRKILWLKVPTIFESSSADFKSWAFIIQYSVHVYCLIANAYCNSAHLSIQCYLENSHSY